MCDININSTNNRVNTGTNPATANIDAKYIDTKLSDFFKKASKTSKIGDSNGESHVVCHKANAEKYVKQKPGRNGTFDINNPVIRFRSVEDHETNVVPPILVRR